MAREARETAREPGDLTRVRERLEEWRSSHARGVAFPEALWISAGRVAQRRGVYVTARALGLEYNKLKRMSGGESARVKRKATARSRPKPMKFIDVTGALPVTLSGCRLSLRNADGRRLELEMAPGAATEMVLQLCRSGWSASP